MQTNLTDKVALVTGGARRIGAAITRTLHQSGMRVIVHYGKSFEEAKTLVSELNHERPNSAALVEGHFEEALDYKTFAANCLACFGRLDALVNNASQFYPTSKDKLDTSAFDHLMQVNAKVPFFLAEALAQELEANRGAIVNITDIHGDSPLRDYGIYSISKAALIMATKVLAKEWGPHVRVNAVSPGPIIWPEGENSLSPETKNRIIESTLLKRVGNKEAIARAVLYFIRDADYVTGQILRVDGGRLLTHC